MQDTELTDLSNSENLPQLLPGVTAEDAKRMG